MFNLSESFISITSSSILRNHQTTETSSPAPLFIKQLSYDITHNLLNIGRKNGKNKKKMNHNNQLIKSDDLLEDASSILQKVNM